MFAGPQMGMMNYSKTGFGRIFVMKKGLKSCLLVVLILVGLCVAVTAGMFFTKICPPQGPWPMPPWCAGSSIDAPFISSPPAAPAEYVADYIPYGEGEAYLKQPTLFITWAKDDTPFEKMPGTAFNWQVIWHVDGKIPDYTIREMRHFQSLGVRYIGYLAEPDHQWDEKFIPMPQSATIDIDSNPIHLQKPGMGAFGADQYWMNILDPDWQSFLISQTKEMIDLGVEGVLVDDYTFNVHVIPAAKGTFDKYSMEGFTQYLKDKYSAAELKAKFDIDNIDQFNLKEYIQEKNLPDDWNVQRPPLPIIYEFEQFQLVGSDKFFRSFAAQLKEYGKTQGRHIFFATGSGSFEGQRIPLDYMDYATGEEFYFSPYSLPSRVAVNNKLYQGRVPTRIVRVEVTLGTNPPPLETKNLFKYIFADIYSTNGKMIVEQDTLLTLDNNGNYVPAEQSIRYDQDEAARYVNFASAHKDLYGLDEPASIALVRSEASIKGGQWGMPIEERNVWTGNSVVGIADMLYNLNVPFDMLHSGDEDLFKSRLTQADLARYDVVILPTIFMLSNPEVEALLEYARAGGKVISIGDFATHDLYGQKADRPDLEALKPAGEHALGEGTWLTIPEEIGEQYAADQDGHTYQPTERSVDDPLLQTFHAALEKYYTPEIMTDAPITVSIRRYVDGTRLVLHMVNYNFDQAADQFVAAGPFDVSVAVDGLELTKAKLYNFEAGTVTEIPLEQADGLVKFTVPDLYAYSIVELLP
jgi:hypothetical protein